MFSNRCLPFLAAFLQFVLFHYFLRNLANVPFTREHVYLASQGGEGNRDSPGQAQSVHSLNLISALKLSTLNFSCFHLVLETVTQQLKTECTCCPEAVGLELWPELSQRPMDSVLLKCLSHLRTSQNKRVDQDSKNWLESFGFY